MGISKARSDHVRLEREGAWRIVDGWEWLFFVLFFKMLRDRYFRSPTRQSKSPSHPS